MRRPLLPLAAALLAFAATPAPAAAVDESGLRSTLTREMRLAGASSGAIVRDLRSGEDLFALRPDAPRIPASVDKLFTTSTALLRLGADATVDTLAQGTGAVDPAGVLQGDLVLAGRGDAFLGPITMGTLARNVRAAGVRRVAGAVLADDTYFDRRPSVRFGGYDSDLGGVLNAATYNRGVDRGRARLDAAAHSATAFRSALREAGVAVSGAARAGGAPEGAVEVARVASAPVRTLAQAINTPSNNFAAEMLLKDLGARFGGAGTTASGAAVVRDTLDDFGVRPRIADGSGLSRANRTTPRQVVRLLERLDGQAPVRSAFRASLSVAGRTGTLRRRLRGTPASGACRGKTGTLRGVSAVVGLCRTTGGRDVAFAFLLNGVNTISAKRVEDRMVAAVARLER